MHTDLMPPSGDPAAIRQALYDAVAVAALAPSIFNSQPWRWEIRDNGLDLWADRTRHIREVDPDGRLLVLSCGAALHHATVELAGVGYRLAVDRLPDPADADRLARVAVDGIAGPDAAAAALSRRAWDRRTDRRPFGGRAVSADDLADLCAAGRGERVVVHELTAESRRFLSIAAAGAATIEARSADYRAALATWVGRGPGADDGVPLATVVPRMVARPVGLRDFALGADADTLDAGEGDDSAASYLVIATADDAPADWLAAGEAASAVLLTATDRDLATSPMSDVVEVPGARVLVRSLLPDHAAPQLVIRVGVASADTALPASPRRSPGDTIHRRDADATGSA